MPDSIEGGTGEASWTDVSFLYGGGMQFMRSTWNAAAALSRGLLPFVSSNAAIAADPPAAQIYAAFLIVSKDGSWHEWPWTSRACGLR